MVELTWYYGWSKWKAKDDTDTVYFLWDVTGKLPFAMVASKHSDSPALYKNIYLPTFSESNTWDFCLVMTRTSETSQQTLLKISEDTHIHIFCRRLKPWAAKPREKPLAQSGTFYHPRWPLSFFIRLHLRQTDWKSPTVIMWAGTWRNVQRPTLCLAKQVRV